MATETEMGTIVVVDGDPTSRNEAEDLEDECDRQVIAIDSVDFDTEVSEDILEAAVYIFRWDLGIRSGVDLLEEVRINPRLANKKVLIAAEDPTRSMVQWAMSMGADGFCRVPYDPEEVKVRLAAIEGESSAP